MRRLPPLISLLYFEAAARTKSFARAAKELHVTPAAVSHQVKALEDFLGVELFVRHNRTVTLTPVVLAALPTLQHGFEALSNAVEQMRSYGSLQLGITVCAEPLFATKWIVPRLHRFYERCPDAEIRIQASVNSIDTQAKEPPNSSGLLRAGIDLSVRFGHGDYSDVHVEKLLDVQLVPVISPHLGLVLPVSPNALLNYPLLTDTSTLRSTSKFGWTEWFASMGHPIPDGFKERRFGNALLALEAAIAGQGGLLIGEHFIQPELQSGSLCVVSESTFACPYSYYLTAPSRSLDRPIVRLFRDWIFDEMNDANKVTGQRKLVSRHRSGDTVEMV